MPGGSHEVGLIPNKIAAVAAFILTGFVATLSFRDAFFRSPRPSHALLLRDFLGLPQWVLLAINVAFYGYLVWVCILFFRIAQGRERAIVAGWSLGIVLFPAKYFLSTSTAAAIRYVDCAAMVVALLAALTTLLRYFDTGRAQT